MTKKLSGADWRLFSAILAVIFLLVATQPSDDCENCMEEKLTATFTDLSPKTQSFAGTVLPNAFVIVHNGLKGDLAVLQFPMVSKETKTIKLEGQEAYSYLILELDWGSLDKLSLIDQGLLTAKLAIASQQERTELMKPYGKPIRCISVGIILMDTTISFTSKGEISDEK